MLPVYGGQDISRQISGLRGVQIIVGTPGEQTGNRLFLNGGQLVKSHFSDGPHNALIQKGFNIRQTVLSGCPFCKTVLEKIID